MKKIISSVLLFAPALASAQATAVTDVNSLSIRILNLFNVAIYVLVALAIVFIVYNVVMFVIKGNDPEAKTAALKSIGWGLVGLAIIVSIWGLVGILTRSFRTVDPAVSIPSVTNSVPLVP